MQRKTASIGPISSDTIGEFSSLVAESRDWSECDTEEMSQEEEETRDEHGSDILGELFDALDSFSAPYCYFGASEGDGACYGWFISQDSLDDDCRYGEVLKVSDLAEVPEDYAGTVLHVNDHGNETLYEFAAGKSREVWSVV